MMAPRSTLHALTPTAAGTPAVESLLSYFCRLAASHAVSTATLARALAHRHGHDIRPDFEWQQRNLSGVGEAATTWAAWLSADTGVAALDRLTLSRWSGVLPASGLMARQGRWCPHCLREDLQAGRSPYFRLAWELNQVSACPVHKVRLTDTCPHCGRGRARHHGAIVVPGWCSHCGGFLGEAPSAPASPIELWTARQTGDWLAPQSSSDDPPEADSLRATLRILILKLDGGRYAAFARRLGLAKSTVHHWLHQGGLPSLEAWLAITRHAGWPLARLLQGDLEGWTPPARDEQLLLHLDTEPVKPRAKPRQHDWDAIRQSLSAMLREPEAISVAEAGRRLGLDDRHLYLRANDLARALGQRWKKHLAENQSRRKAEAVAHIRRAILELQENGQGVSWREIQTRVPLEILNGVEGVFDLIAESRNEAGPSS